MISKKRKMRIFVATILIIFVVLIYLNLLGIIFPKINNKYEYKFSPIDIPESSSVEEVKIAFFGDQGVNSDSKKVLEIAKGEGVDLIMLLGDFDYEDNPKKFRKMYESVYGNNYPLLSVVGNHDVSKWGEYRDWMKDIEIDNLNCTGTYGEAAICNFGPVSFIISAIGTLPGEHKEFLEYSLPKVDNAWKICAWHKNSNSYQVGGKNTEVGNDMYQLCADNEAIIMTAHEHSYSRTHAISNLMDLEIGDSTSPYDLNNNSMVFVSGLGGKSSRDTHDDMEDIWASIYSEDEGAVAGSLICSFRESVAKCKFININREVIDEFEMRK